jgi:CRISPR-associated protein (TIGR02584 family)
MKSTQLKRRVTLSAKSAKSAKSAVKPAPQSEIKDRKSETGYQKPEIVLLAVTGMSPAVLTETIWALARENPPVVPDRVVVITTTEGSKRLNQALFTPPEGSAGQGPWDALRAWLECQGHDLSQRLRYEERILRRWNEPRHAYEPLADIRNRADNEAAADFIIEQVRSFSEADDTRIVATIAGGRKTMGALLYACMTILGREQDRLTHVLVGEPYETGVGGNFFFPDQPLQALATRDGSTVKASGAHVELADVPFVPLRNLFERDLVKRRGTFTALVNTCRKQVADQLRRQVRLLVHRSRPQIKVNDVSVKLSAKQHLFLILLAERASQAQPPFAKYAEAATELRNLGETLHAEKNPDDFNDWRYSVRLPPDAGEQIFRKLRDEVIHKLEARGPGAAALIPLLPQAGRCSLDLPPAAIEFVD